MNMDTRSQIAVLAAECIKSLWPEAEGLPGAVGIVAAVHPPEDSVVQRLHAHAHAVHPQIQ